MKRTCLLLLLLTSCAGPFRRGADAYHDGMSRLGHNAELSRADFLEADAALAEALADPGLPTSERVTATSIRVRTLIELERHPEARDVAAAPIPGFEPGLAYSGDRVGLALLRARTLDAERAFAALLAAERETRTLRAGIHLAWEQVRLLRALNTPASRAEAAKICERHPGRLDFDAQLKELRP
ncbi:MAG TPA: hypothetical protein VF950_28730 [Planctomycetota bacterium]